MLLRIPLRIQLSVWVLLRIMYGSQCRNCQSDLTELWDLRRAGYESLVYGDSPASVVKSYSFVVASLRVGVSLRVEQCAQLLASPCAPREQRFRRPRG